MILLLKQTPIIGLLLVFSYFSTPTFAASPIEHIHPGIRGGAGTDGGEVAATLAITFGKVKRIPVIVYVDMDKKSLFNFSQTSYSSGLRFPVDRTPLFLDLGIGYTTGKVSCFLCLGDINENFEGSYNGISLKSTLFLHFSRHIGIYANGYLFKISNKTGINSDSFSKDGGISGGISLLF